MKQTLTLLLTILLLSSVTCNAHKAGGDGFGDIRNDTFWDTADGKPLYSHGGGIFRFTDPATGKDRYYWYGVRYKGSE